MFALGLFFPFLTPGVEADWQSYPSIEGRGIGLGKQPGRRRKGEVKSEDRHGVRECQSKTQSKKGK